MRPSPAGRCLPETYRRALELHGLGVEQTELAARLGIEVCAVGPLLAVAAAKLSALQNLHEPDGAHVGPSQRTRSCAATSPSGAPDTREAHQ